MKTGNSHKYQQNRKRNSAQEKDKKKKEPKKEKSVVILGDSMVKHLNRWKMFKKIKNFKVYVRSFPCAKVQCMDN